MQKTLLYTLLGGALLVSPAVRAQIVQKQLGHTFRIEKVVKNVSDVKPHDNVASLLKKAPKTGNAAARTKAATSNAVRTANAAAKANVAQAQAEAITPDWSSSLATQEDFDQFTVIDANNDAVDAGTYKKDTWSFNGAATFFYSDKNKGDDWLISPAFKLKAGQSYKVTANVNVFVKDKHKLEIKWGKAATAEGMTESGLAETVIPAFTKQDLEATITPETDGTYYVGLHALSEAGGYNLYLNTFDIKALANPNVPAEVTDITVTPDPQAQLKATIQFKVPSTTADGKQLDALKGVKIERGGKLIADITDVKAGQTHTYIDNTVEAAGVQTYSLAAYSDKGEGKAASVDQWVGLDTPASTARPVLANPDDDELVLTWQPFGAANGGVVLPDQIRYDVYSAEIVNGQAFVGESVGFTTGGNNELVSTIDTEEGEQQYSYQCLQGSNDAGKSKFVLSTPVVTGKPYDLPVREDFADGSINHFWAYEQDGNGELLSPAAGVFIVSNSDADGNGVSLLIRTMMNDVISFYTGKVNVSQYANPTLSFKFKGNTSSGTFIPFVEKRDGTRTNLAEESLSTSTLAWTLKQYSLKDYASEKWVKIGFTVSDPDGNTEQDIYLDDINIDDLKPVDLAAGIDYAPEEVEKGKSDQATVKVRNYGSQTVNSYQLKVSLGDNVLLDQTVKRKLAPFGTHTYPVDIAPAIIELADKGTLKVEVTQDQDAVADNNTAETEIVFTAPDLLPATALAVTETSSAHTLAWTAPSATRTTTDSFENETAWATTGIGKWTTEDGDGGVCFGLLDNYGVTYDSEGAPFAFTVFNPSRYGGYDITSLFENVTPKSGSQSLAAFYSAAEDAASGYYDVIDADNWLISPQLTGKEQQVSFWANNFNESGTDPDTDEDYEYDYPETFDVLYSNSDNSTASFMKIGDTHTLEGGKWTKVDVQLPAGAKYFAIHHNSKVAYDDDGYIMSPWLFQIDDVTYNTSNLKVLKYNIYRDGTLLTSTTDTRYVDTSATAGEHVYQVTVVYEGNLESAPVNAGAPTGIGQLPANTTTGNAIVGIYTVDGKKVSQPVKGINIVKMKDGSAKKIIK